MAATRKNHRMASGVTGPTLDLELPIFDQGQGEIAKLAAQYRQAQRQLQSLAIRIRSEVREARDTLKIDRDQVNYYKKMVLPLNVQSVNQTLLQYNAMQINTYDLFLTKQHELEAERDYIEAWRDYWISRSQLEEAVGGSLRPTQLQRNPNFMITRRQFMQRRRWPEVRPRWRRARASSFSLRGLTAQSHLHRRRALARAAGHGLQPVVVSRTESKLPWKVVDGAKVFHLIAQEVDHEFAPGLMGKGWGYNGMIHGPTIEAVEGDRVRIYVTNQLPEPTTVHWHGVLLPNGMDGVGGLTQHIIQPGETFKYEFALRQHGTFMYHPHHDEMTQMALGMMGLFVIHPRTARRHRADRDFAIMLSEWQIVPGTSRPDPNEMTEFNVLTMNARGVSRHRAVGGQNGRPSSHPLRQSWARWIIIRFICTVTISGRGDRRRRTFRNRLSSWR